MTESRVPVNERAFRERIDPRRGRAAILDLGRAVTLVRDRHRLDFTPARARAGISRGHLIDIVLELPGGRNAADEQIAAERLVELVLGEARGADWVGSITSVAAPRGNTCCRVLQPRGGRAFLSARRAQRDG